jgi:hypothetical protein
MRMMDAVVEGDRVRLLGGEGDVGCLMQFLLDELGAYPYECTRILEAIAPIRSGAIAKWSGGWDLTWLRLTEQGAELLENFGPPRPGVYLTHEELERPLRQLEAQLRARGEECGE